MGGGALPRVPGLTLLRRLGAGSTGTVYAARRDLDGWSCAVKVAADLLSDAQAELVHEAALLGSVRLPHLITLHEVLETSDGRVAMILDLVDGGNVAELVEQRGRLDPAEAVTVLAPVLRTLGELHRRGIVHGDVSASNVLVGHDGRPMLTDLGRARLVGQRPASAGGTLEYLAPEVNAPGPATAAADVYAAGALGWRLLTGEPVPPGLVRRPLAEVAAGCPAALGFVIDDCLRGDPAARPSPQRAADAVLAACRATPLQLPEGEDPAEQLTFRLREGLGRTAYRSTFSGDDVRPDPPYARSGRGAPHEPTGRHRRVASGRRSAARPWRARRGRIAAVVYGLVGLGVFVAAYAGVRWIASPGAQQTGTTTTTTTAVAAVRTEEATRSAGDSVPGAPSMQPPMPSGSTGPSAIDSPSGSPTGASTGSSTGASTGSAAGPLGGSSIDSPSGPPLTPLAAPTGVRTTPSPDPRRTPSGPLAELPALVDARARAYRQADGASLTRAYAPGSAAAAADRADVAALRRAGVRYQGLRYALVAPVVERIGSGVCVVRVRIDTLRYVERRADAPGRVRPGLRGVPVRLHLVRTPAGWRIADVRPG